MAAASRRSSTQQMEHQKQHMQHRPRLLCVSSIVSNSRSSVGNSSNSNHSNSRLSAAAAAAAAAPRGSRGCCLVQAQSSGSSGISGGVVVAFTKTAAAPEMQLAPEMRLSGTALSAWYAAPQAALRSSTTRLLAARRNKLGACTLSTATAAPVRRRARLTIGRLALLSGNTNRRQSWRRAGGCSSAGPQASLMVTCGITRRRRRARLLRPRARPSETHAYMCRQVCAVYMCRQVCAVCGCHARSLRLPRAQSAVAKRAVCGRQARSLLSPCAQSAVAKRAVCGSHARSLR